MCKQQDHQNTAATAAASKAEAPKEEATYLVIGAGTAGLSFIDSLLTLDAEATVILVDRNSQPGGHWTKAYPFVTLHQPSCNYGVNSLPLSNIRDKKGNERFSVNDLASGPEILDYYKKVVEQFRGCGRVQFYFNCEYSKDESGGHFVTNIDTNEVTQVSFKKIVTVHSNILVPSMREGEAPFPIDSSISFAPLNDLPTHIESKQYKKYVVIGAGKTGSDAITYLLRNGVDQSAITWITSRDNWYIIRDGLWQGYESYRKDTAGFFDPLVTCSSLHDVLLEYEKSGILERIDTTRTPEVFKGAIIDKSELAGLRSIKDIVRLGRITSITSDEIRLEKGTVPVSSPSDTLFVDCMADVDGTFYAFGEDFQIFDGDHINLGPILVTFNVSFSSALIAYIESTFEDDDDMRNSLLFFARGEENTKPDYKFLFSQFYCGAKTLEALSRAYPPAIRFIMRSRTFLDAPSHHHRGRFGLLWALIGPSQMSKKSHTFLKRVARNDYPDCQNCFGCEGRKLPRPWDLKTKKKKANVKSNYPPQKKKKKSKLILNCCATEVVANAVENHNTVASSS